ncbi:Lrp/AsnC family transcriptional regulator, partial [Candidatus Bathyarchaeota archaeon]|nr:Lrp/AsnC family transcriptional regulator [Candidatus Bathyarchaeota archaeon]
SDRKLADSIGVSQPTVTRRRARLEKELSLHYTVIPDFSKLGMEIVAIHFVQWKPEGYETLSQTEDLMKKMNEFLSKHPNVIFASSGQGCGFTRMAVTVHRDYSDFVNFRTDFEKDWGQYTAKYESFIISLKSDKVLRHLTLKYLADYIKNTNSP